MLGNGGSGFDTGWLLTDLLEKIVDSEKVVSPENGFDRLRNGQLPLHPRVNTQ